MGNVTTRVGTKVTKPVRDYNIHERAHKAVLKNKYEPSPKHPSTINHIQKSIQTLPEEIKQSLKVTDANLGARLKDVYVTSKHDTVQIPRSSDAKPLPLDRMSYGMPEYGFRELETVPYGKASLKNVIEMISKYKSDPAVHTPEVLAESYKLNTDITKNILNHFGTFKVYIPSTVSPKQEELLHTLQASSTSLPLTPELSDALSGIALTNPQNVKEGKLTYETLEVQPEKEEHEGEFTMTSDIKSVNEGLGDLSGTKDEGMDKLIKEVVSDRTNGEKSGKTQS